MTVKLSNSKSNVEVPISFEEALDRTGNGLYNYLLLAACSLILLAIGVDLFGFSMVVTAACDLQLSVSEKGILTSIPFVGIIMTSFIWGFISDKKGRRFTLVVPLFISFVLSCISSLSPHWLFLGLAKFLSVCFSCAANSATYTLMGESCIQRVRSKYMLLMTCLLILSSAVAGVITYPILKLNFSTPLAWLGISFTPWRLLAVVHALPLGIGAFALCFFFESPKFLYSKGRKEEAVNVLRRMFEMNHKGTGENYKVTSISTEEVQAQKPMSLPRAIMEQSLCLFRPPYLIRSLQLYYIVAVVFITNNSFLVWFPHIMNLLFRGTDDSSVSEKTGICSLIVQQQQEEETPENCIGTIEDNVIISLIVSQSIFAFLNFIVSYFPNRKKAMLITILCLSAVSGATTNLIPEPIASVFIFMMFPCTCLGMGILAAYFVELYPTSYRGMAACLSIMVGRSCAFLGINLVAYALFNYCHLTFYLWSLLVLSSVVVAWFLPPDQPAVKVYNSRL